MNAPIIVTGANGFVGRALLQQLGRAPFALAMTREDWEAPARSAPFAGATVFHLAARVHRMDASSEEEYQRDNALKTRRLAELAAQRGAERIVLLSTIKVNGEETGAKPFAADDPPAPEDAYARSKLAAETALREVAARGGPAFTVVRAPIVYGRGARGNLRSLLRLADSPWPLPFAALRRPRSFVHVDDLAALLVACALEPQAAGRVYLASHRDPGCTAELVAALRRELGRAQRLFAVPPSLIEALGALAGQAGRARRLTRALEVDASAAERELGWHAQRSLQDSAADLVDGYRAAP